MKKMPCLFRRTFLGDRSFILTPEVTPGCEWVLGGEGVATRKRDGTACAVIEGTLYRRYDAKKDPKTDQYKPLPTGRYRIIPCDDPDPVTGHWPHWMTTSCDHAEDRWHSEAWVALIPLEVAKAARESDQRIPSPLPDGTYELCGPKINGNPERLDKHVFFRHGDELLDPVRSHDGLRDFLERINIEGIVFHHPDGRMCKIRRNDYGFTWPVGGAA